MMEDKFSNEETEVGVIAGGGLPCILLSDGALRSGHHVECCHEGAIFGSPPFTFDTAFCHHQGYWLA